MNPSFKDLGQLFGKMQSAQQALSEITATGEAGAGMVKIEMSGRQHVHRVEIDPELLAGDDTTAQAKIIEELLLAAFNDAIKKVEKASQERLMQLATSELAKGDDDTNE